MVNLLRASMCTTHASSCDEYPNALWESEVPLASDELAHVAVQKRFSKRGSWSRSSTLFRAMWLECGRNILAGIIRKARIFPHSVAECLAYVYFFNCITYSGLPDARTDRNGIKFVTRENSPAKLSRTAQFSFLLFSSRTMCRFRGTVTVCARLQVRRCEQRPPWMIWKR